MIAVGLSIGFRANVWNIGAEGQYVIGGLAGTGVGARDLAHGGLVDPAADVHRRRRSAAWPTRRSRRSCKTRFNVNEILSSLMLTYVAIQLLYYLMNGPWKDPEGFNFPQSAAVQRRARCCPTSRGTRAISDVPLALVIALAVWFLMAQDHLRLPGPRRRRGAAGGALRRLQPRPHDLAGAARSAAGWPGSPASSRRPGPFGQMVPQFPTGYGFTAIIVAFLGRLHPIGIIARRHRPRRHLCRRRGGAGHARAAELGDRRLPGDDAVLPARHRHPRQLPAAPAPPRGRSRVMSTPSTSRS